MIIILSVNSINSVIDDERGIINQHKIRHNQTQLALQLCCLSFLWNFAETPEDRKFVLSKGVLPLTIDALLLHPQLPDDVAYGIDIYGLKIGVNETAIGCCGGRGSHNICRIIFRYRISSNNSRPSINRLPRIIAQK